jgi:hypothetical protein
LPFHVTSRGRPTFTESNRGMRTSSKSSVWLASFHFGAAASFCVASWSAKSGRYTSNATPAEAPSESSKHNSEIPRLIAAASSSSLERLDLHGSIF